MIYGNLTIQRFPTWLLRMNTKGITHPLLFTFPCDGIPDYYRSHLQVQNEVLDSLLREPTVRNTHIISCGSFKWLFVPPQQNDIYILVSGLSIDLHKNESRSERLGRVV